MWPYVLGSSHGLSHEFQSMTAFQLWVLSGTGHLLAQDIHASLLASRQCYMQTRLQPRAWCGLSESPGGGSPVLPGVEVIAELPQRLPCALNSPRPLSTAGCLGGFLLSGTELRAVKESIGKAPAAFS